MKKKLGPRQRHARIFAALREAGRASGKAEKRRVGFLGPRWESGVFAALRGWDFGILAKKEKILGKKCKNVVDR